MNSPKHRFFIALLPPQAVQEYANAVKQVFAEKYQSQAALRSPPHITLYPPFEWPIDSLPKLVDCLSTFALQQAAVPIRLSGFGAFPPRVIYIQSDRSPELIALQTRLVAVMQTQLGLVDQAMQTRPFVPHLTVGFRDLTTPNFHAAWAEFEQQPIEFAFQAIALTLLRHDGQRWESWQNFPLAANLS